MVLKPWRRTNNARSEIVKWRNNDGELLLDIVDIALPDGYGVGKINSLVYFVPGAVVGDRVRIRVRRKHKKFSFGGIVEIERLSPFRCEPACGSFGSCGGCLLQHVSYEKQLDLKENHLRQVLSRIGGLDISSLDIMPIVPSSDLYHHRNKVELAFGGGPDGAVLGFRERVNPAAQHVGRVVPVIECPVFGESLEKIIPLFNGFAHDYRLSFYDPVTQRGLLRHLAVRESKSTGEIMIILETTAGSLPDMAPLWRSLKESLPRLKSLYRAINTQSVDTGLYETEHPLFGEPFIREESGGLSFRIYPQSFFQPNTKTAEIMNRTIAGIAGSGAHGRAVGLYCGSGSIELSLASMIKEVIGVDSNPANIANARENCRLNDIRNCTFIEDRVESVRGRLPIAPDLLLIDPPRGGVSGEGLSLMCDLKPKKIVYVSCNPSTLSRDLRYLGEKGYAPRRIIPFDAFPHTAHLESVTLIERT